MAVDRGDRGPLWVDGRITLRVRGPGAGPGRVVRTRGPFALIGRAEGAEVRLLDEAVDDRHALLILDRRGVFGVDLRTRSGTRFAGSGSDSARLGVGDVLEVAGRRVEVLQLRVDGSAFDPPLSDDDPLAEAPPSAERSGLTLEPVDAPGPPWALGSALAFVGRGPACAIRVGGPSAPEVHCALLRGPSCAYVINLFGGPARFDGRPVEAASRLLDGDVLDLGPARFAIRVGTPGGPSRSALALPPDAPRALAHPGSRDEILEALRLIRADAATLFEAQVGRIEALGREVAALRAQLQARDRASLPGPEPLRLDLPPLRPSESAESAAWLVDRIHHLEAEGRSTWKDLLDRIAATVRPRPAPGRPLDDVS